MKNFKNYICIIIFVITFMFVGYISVEAKTLGDLKKELKSVEDKYSTNQSDKAQTEEEINTTKTKINSLNKQKAQVQSEIKNLNDEIDKIFKEIQSMESDIKLIINYYQLTDSPNFYLEYIFNAKDFTDFIYRLSVTEQLVDSLQGTINKYNDLKEQNIKKVNELTQKEVSLNKLEQQLSEQLTKLGSNLKTISEASIDIKDEINTLKQRINTYENTYKCSLTEELSSCQYRYEHPSNSGSSSNSGSFVPNSTGFYMPVTSGRVNANYGYSDYYGSSYHYGIDIGVSHGTPVYSIANGRVVNVTNRSSCGGNMVYIAHVVNGKSYTSAYFHLASINARVGQTVTPNTVIGYSGGVPSIETWDNCSTGAHVHLQMATGLYMTDYFWYSNFQSRSFDPRNILRFPAWGQYFSGR